jgi:hypothetical protein
LENPKKQSALATLYNTLPLDGNSCLFFFLIVFIRANAVLVENQGDCLDCWDFLGDQTEFWSNSSAARRSQIGVKILRRIGTL